MEHHPKVSRRHVQNLTDFFARHVFHLAQGESRGCASGKFGQTTVQGFLKFHPLEILRRVCSPICGAKVMMPVAGLVEELRDILRDRIRIRPLAAQSAEVIYDFVLEDSYQPGSFRRLTGELVAGLKRGEQSFLNHFFGKRRVSEPDERVSEKRVAMSVQPDIGFESLPARHRRHYISKTAVGKYED
jgi:hypothetical protein